MRLVEDKGNDEGPPIKRFKHLNRVSECLKNKEDEESLIPYRTKVAAMFP